MNRILNFILAPRSLSACQAFYAADVALLLLAGWLTLRPETAPGPLRVAVVILCVLTAAVFGLLPVAREFALSQTAQPPLPEPSPAPADSAAAPAASEVREPEARLVEIVLLAWRMQKRLAGQPELSRPLVRNTEKILELLRELDVEVISYAGRKLDLGSRVNVLEWVEGEENRVVEEHEPQVQIRGRLVRQALVTAGKGLAPVGTQS